MPACGRRALARVSYVMSTRARAPPRSRTLAPFCAGEWPLLWPRLTLEGLDNITLVPLPPRSPELNPVENIWQFMRDKWLSNRVFTSYDDIVDHCCEAWNELNDQPLAHHVHRPSPMGAWILINELWYKRSMI